MKNKYSIGFLILFSGVLISENTQAQVMGPSTEKSYYAQGRMAVDAQASLDLIKIDDKGNSYYNAKDRPKITQNIGFRLYINLSNPEWEDMQNGFKTHSRIPKMESASLDSFVNINLRNHYFFKLKKPKPFFYIKPGLVYTGKHTQESQNGASTDINLNYLEIPATLNYQIPVNYFSAVHFGIGPYFAYALSGNFVHAGTKTLVHFGNDPNSDDFKKTDYGLIFSTGYRIFIRWNLTLEYELGLKNISATPPDPDTHLHGFSISLGYKLF